jgi:hypothetical protein
MNVRIFLVTLLSLFLALNIVFFITSLPENSSGGTYTYMLLLVGGQMLIPVYFYCLVSQYLIHWIEKTNRIRINIITYLLTSFFLALIVMGGFMCFDLLLEHNGKTVFEPSRYFKDFAVFLLFALINPILLYLSRNFVQC